MSRYLSILIATAFSLSLLTSCEQDLEYDVPTTPPQLVVNGLFAADSTWRVEVSTSASPGMGNRIMSLKDAKIVLTQNKSRTVDLFLDSTVVSRSVSGQSSSTPLYHFRSRKSVPKAGHQYSIAVSHRGYESVNARGSVPFPGVLRMRTVRDIANQTISLQGRRMRKYDFSLLDHGDNNTVFMIELVERNKDGSQSHRVDFFSDEAVFQEDARNSTASTELSSGWSYSSNRGVFFTNQTFRGKERYFTLYADSKFGEGDEQLMIRVTTLSSDLYEYLKSYHKQQAIQGNPFAQPVQVYSNIRNGYGIFAGYSVSEIQVR